MQPYLLVPPTDWSGRRVTVMGLGRFGGGVGVVKFLLQHGARVTLTDLATERELADSLQQFDARQLAVLRLGEHRAEDFSSAEIVVVNPAVPLSHPLLRVAQQAGAQLTTEINLFWQLQRGRIAAVTGTVGKSTTALLLAKVLESAINFGSEHHARLGTIPRVRLAGNIGISLLDQVEQIQPTDWTVLELSSYQLARLGPLQPRPDVAVITTVFPNHLNWHGTTADYLAAKQELVRYLTPAQSLVYPGSDTTGNQFEGGTLTHPAEDWPSAAQKLRVELPGLEETTGFMPDRPQVISVNHTPLGELHPGHDLPAGSLPSHPLLQAAALALAAGRVVWNVPLERCLSAIRSARTLPHRLEVLGEFQGRLFINDSKATTPRAAMAGLSSLQRPVRLLAGGADQSETLSDWAELVRQRVASVALVGGVAERWLREIQLRGGGDSEFASIHPSLATAFDWLWKSSVPGDVILLSPGCPSYGEFRNYEERGELFRELFNRLSKA